MATRDTVIMAVRRHTTRANAELRSWLCLSIVSEAGGRIAWYSLFLSLKGGKAPPYMCTAHVGPALSSIPKGSSSSASHGVIRLCIRGTNAIYRS